MANRLQSPAQLSYSVHKGHLTMALTAWGKDDERCEAALAKVKKAEESLLQWGTDVVKYDPRYSTAMQISMSREQMIAFLMRVDPDL